MRDGRTLPDYNTFVLRLIASRRAAIGDEYLLSSVTFVSIAITIVQVIIIITVIIAIVIVIVISM